MNENKARYAPERDRIPEFRVVSNSVFILSFHDRIKKKEVVFVFSTWFDFLPKSAIKIFGVLTSLKITQIITSSITSIW